MLRSCPVCGAPGDDLVFAFECSNPACQNYSPTAHPPFGDQDLRLLLRSIWAIYRQGESLDEFIRRFFAEGGRVEPDDVLPGVENARVHEPESLRHRMASAA
jgi:hypothetical protein